MNSSVLATTEDVNVSTTGQTTRSGRTRSKSADFPKTRARWRLVQFLYANENTECRVDGFSMSRDEFLDWQNETHMQARGYFSYLLTELIPQIHQIDLAIKSYCRKFRFERLLATDRQVLRVAFLELKLKSAPARVVMDEAISMARNFGDENSGSFVNGVLNAYLHDLRESSSEPN